MCRHKESAGWLDCEKCLEKKREKRILVEAKIDKHNAVYDSAKPFIKTYFKAIQNAWNSGKLYGNPSIYGKYSPLVGNGLGIVESHYHKEPTFIWDYKITALNDILKTKVR